MEIDDLILVSVDDHVIEPPDLFDGHVSGEAAERAPRVVKRPDGSDVWVFEGKEIPNIALNAVAGRPREEYNFEPTAYTDCRPGCYDIHQRVRDMDVNGVLGSICFPSMTGFAGQLFMKCSDRDIGLRLLQAYNDWHIADWAGAYPERIIPQGVMPSWDPPAMGAEVRRLAGLGCHAVTFSENPHKLGLPSLHSDSWDPFWKACSEVGTVVNMHIGSSSSVIITAPDAPVDVSLALSPANSLVTLGDLLFSRVLKEFPDLRIALSEGGIGWMPWLLDRADYVYQNHHAWTGQDFGGKRPSDVFRERIIGAFVDDPAAMLLQDWYNFDNLTWECDYPHSDSSWPNSPELVQKHMADFTDERINKITHENAMRHYQFDPFKTLDRSECTVGALRARSADVDLTFAAERLTAGNITAAGFDTALSAFLMQKDR